MWNIKEKTQMPLWNHSIEQECRMLQSILQEGAMTAYSDILKMREAGRRYQVILDVGNGYRIEEILEYEKIWD